MKDGKPLSKYRKITSRSKQDDYEHNVWRAVEDMWVEMYASYDMSIPEINEKVIFLVDAYCQFLTSETRKDLHGMSAKRRRKYR